MLISAVFYLLCHCLVLRAKSFENVFFNCGNVHLSFGGSIYKAVRNFNLLSYFSMFIYHYVLLFVFSIPAKKYCI